MSDDTDDTDGDDDVVVEACQKMVHLQIHPQNHQIQTPPWEVEVASFPDDEAISAAAKEAEESVPHADDSSVHSASVETS